MKQPRIVGHTLSLTLGAACSCHVANLMSLFPAPALPVSGSMGVISAFTYSVSAPRACYLSANIVIIFHIQI